MSPPDSRRFLPPDAVARISRLEIQARTVVEGFLSGLHRSPYFGQSIEFAQHREYAPGDDTRRVDWKVWSRTDRYFIKQYEEETNLTTTILVDASESMQFSSGTLSKFDYACQIAAALSYLLLRQHDAVGVTTFDDSVRNVVPPSSRGSQLHAILAALEGGTPNRKTDLESLLKRVANERSQRGVVVMISDLFADRSGLFKGLKLLRQRGHDVLVFHVLDDEELDFTYSGTTKFEGLESAGELVCDPRSLREGYLKAMDAFLTEIRRRCAQTVVDYQTVRTSEHLDAVLRHFLNNRVGMHGGARQ
ncbi:MAG: DUF58 domain-containing protein [Planctomyces sp.]|nr:DUF58 domain-containing protein [Planctomyces sp.]